MISPANIQGSDEDRMMLLLSFATNYVFTIAAHREYSRCLYRDGYNDFSRMERVRVVVWFAVCQQLDRRCFLSAIKVFIFER
jgi:hypothetical protein